MSVRNRLRRARAKQKEKFGIPLNQPGGPCPDVEVLPWAFHPDRLGVQFAPEWFDKQLKAIDKDLYATWHAVHERWLIWVRKPENQNSVCPGWSLLFYWEHPVHHTYLPLSELVFHNLMMRDRTRYRNGAEYFDKIQARVEAAKKSRQQSIDDDRKAFERDVFRSYQISSAGQGNRMALHGDNTLVPSPGERNWRAERRQWMLPPEVLKAEKDDKEKAFYGR